MNNKYRKKPVVVEAIQFIDVFSDVFVFVSEKDHFEFPVYVTDSGDKVLRIKTLEGEMAANKGDWIIRGVNGEFYPCKPDIFQKTYERA
jgi:hypothetical protein